MLDVPKNRTNSLIADLQANNVADAQIAKAKSLCYVNQIARKTSFIPSLYDHILKAQRRISFQKTHLILVTIVMLFVITHLYRVSLKVYEAFLPQANTFENFTRCNSMGR